jgi:putative FmdB family regulatory protein
LPRYLYQCQTCGHSREASLPIEHRDKFDPLCHECLEGPVRRVITPIAFIWNTTGRGGQA